MPSSSAPTENMADSLKALRSIAEKKKPAPSKEPAKEKEKAIAPAPEKPAEKPEETKKESVDPNTGKPVPAKPDDAPKPPEKPAVPEDKAKAKKPVDFLREQYETSKAELEKVRAENKALKEGKPTETPEIKEIIKERDDLRKKVEEYDREMMYVNAEKSEAFKREHQQPYEQAYQDAYITLAEWKVSNEAGAMRDITSDEFARIVTAPTGREALEAARSIYGENIEPGVVFTARQAVIDAHRRFQRAKETLRTTAAEREKQAQESSRQMTELQMTAFKKLNDEAAEKMPEWFKPVDNDDEGNELLEKGFKMADDVFHRPEGMSDGDFLKRKSAIRNMAGAFGRLARDLHRATEKNAELEKELAQFRSSEPANGEPGSETKAESTLSPLQSWLTEKRGK